MKRKVLAALLLMQVSFYFTVLNAFSQTTTVTTYVIDTQQERYSLRWTLTEWLRIKERMRLMDLWLSMFSNPKQDKFRPELSLSHGISSGRIRVKSVTDNEYDHFQGKQIKGQLWLTNIISSTVGVKTLNIDFGAEGFYQTTGSLQSKEDQNLTVATPADATNNILQQKFVKNYAAGVFRIFGKNIQDSSLSVKIGKYYAKNLIPQWQENSDYQHSFQGIVAGSELQIYFTKVLGIEGNYLQYGNQKSAKASTEISGSYYDYLAFIEISLIRLFVGQYNEQWQFYDGITTQHLENGWYSGIKLQL